MLRDLNCDAIPASVPTCFSFPGTDSRSGTPGTLAVGSIYWYCFRQVDYERKVCFCCAAKRDSGVLASDEMRDLCVWA
jgi:hypothetical protein